MDQLLFVREKMICYYKKHETIINFIGKFIAGLLILSIINGIGGYHEALTPFFKGPVSLPFLLLMALLFTVLPPMLANGLLALNVVAQISISLEAAFFVLLLLLLVLVLYVRMAPKMSYLIVAVILGFYFRIPYAVVIFAGLYCGLTSIIPITIGVLIHSFIPFFAGLIENASGPVLAEKTDMFNMAMGFLDSYKLIFENIAGNFDWVFVAFVFAMVICAVYAVTRLSIDYARDIAVGIGALISILGFMIGNIVMVGNYSIVSILLFTMLSAILVECIRFFDSILDYKKAERVQFEDEENYYYVRIIPKILMDEGIVSAEAGGKTAMSIPAAPSPAARPRKAPAFDDDGLPPRKSPLEREAAPALSKRPLQPEPSGMPDDPASLLRRRPESYETRSIRPGTGKPASRTAATDAKASDRSVKPTASASTTRIDLPPGAGVSSQLTEPKPSRPSTPPMVRNLSDIQKPVPPRTNVNRREP